MDCVKAAALSKVVAVGVTTSDITVSCPDGCSFGRRINVVVNYDFNPVVSLIPGFPVQGNATMRIARTNDTGGSCY